MLRLYYVYGGTLGQRRVYGRVSFQAQKPQTRLELNISSKMFCDFRRANVELCSEQWFSA